VQFKYAVSCAKLNVGDVLTRFGGELIDFLDGLAHKQFEDLGSGDSFDGSFGLLLELPSVSSRLGLDRDMIAAARAFATLMMASVGRVDDESIENRKNAHAIESCKQVKSEIRLYVVSLALL
jgi:hypothetical protein